MYDFVNELGYLALATRFKRLSDVMVHSGRKMYKELGIDVEPNWFLIFKLLKKYESLSVTEMATKLHFSHPSVITLIQKMEQNGYVVAKSDNQDARKRNYSLTSKAIATLPKLETIWEAGTVAVENMFKENSSFLDELEDLEVQFSKQSFKDRTLNQAQP